MKTKPLYRSPNGDDWLLAIDDTTGDVTVVHQPNPASGGRLSAMSVQEFLDRGGSGPEHQALHDMIEHVKLELTNGVEPGSSAT